ncbi:MAG: hypothetical protein Q4P20_09415 [Eubacteriales bacterium]|nr:hypothetical protein [Eubacteriales bacterium]
MNTTTPSNVSNIFPFEVRPYADFSSTDKRYKKLNLNQSQKTNINQLLSELPTLAASDMLENAYLFKFPDGVTGTMMQYRNGGVGAAIIGADGKIAAHGGFHKITTQAVMLNAFSAMSIATGQYFLAEINKNFTQLNQKIDKIMDFLYGEKKAELISEVNFVQYAHKNFASIMHHAEQRIATITGLQEARKVAMKDIDFYLNDLDKRASIDAKSYAELEEIVGNVCSIRDTLEVSLQLYVMSCFMETYYAENTDSEYLQSQKEDALCYVRKCEVQILTSFNTLVGRCDKVFKINPLKKADATPLRDRLQEVISTFANGEESQICKAIHAMWDNPFQGKEYYVTREGSVYISV